MQVEVVKLPYYMPRSKTAIELTIPVAIPDLAQVREFAHHLHTQNKSWRGQYQGWPAYYIAEDRSRKPSYSKQAFYPAEFWIGTDQVWTFTIAWEEGAAEEPTELESKYTNGAYQVEEKSSAFFEELRNVQERAALTPEKADTVTQEAIGAIRSKKVKP